LGFPPAAALAVVSGTGAAEYAGALRANGVQSAETLEGSVLLRSPTWDALGDAIAATPRPKGSRLRIEVDPPRM
ncbi:MAG: hypothetical protein JWL72_4730, partial [Ilumatobacteraceae bacterium]|nr:hypothetical protein [Ilumatobacteraceae bacterium]